MLFPDEEARQDDKARANGGDPVDVFVKGEQKDDAADGKSGNGGGKKYPKPLVLDVGLDDLFFDLLAVDNAPLGDIRASFRRGWRHQGSIGFFPGPVTSRMSSLSWGHLEPSMRRAGSGPSFFSCWYGFPNLEQNIPKMEITAST